MRGGIPKNVRDCRLYKEKSIHYKTRNLAISDLNKYYIALDCTIMKFHQEKMMVSLILSTLTPLCVLLCTVNEHSRVSISDFQQMYNCCQFTEEDQFFNFFFIELQYL